LEIPVEARHTNSLSLALKDSGDVLGAASPHELGFASGDEYPKVVTFDLAGSFIYEAGGNLFNATSGLELTAVAASPGLTARRLDGKHFEVAVEAEGEFSLTVAGSWLPGERMRPEPKTFSVDVAVYVRRIVRVEWVACPTQPVYVVSGAPFGSGYLRVYDSTGAAFSPVNATENNALLSVHASAGTRLTVTGGLRSLVALGEEQVVSVRHASTEIGTFVLVPPARVDGMRTGFFLNGSHTRGATEIGSGDSLIVRPPAEGEAHIVAVPVLSVDGTPVCSRVLPEWFSLDAQTPDVCPLVTAPVCEFCEPDTLPEGVRLQSAGECRFLVAAPQFNAGQGSIADLVVELRPPE
jgi:hypothetical protein